MNDLYHYGILGMKWGVRRYQNPDGTLTEAGKKKNAKYIKNKNGLVKQSVFRKAVDLNSKDLETIKNTGAQLSQLIYQMDERIVYDMEYELEDPKTYSKMLQIVNKRQDFKTSELNAKYKLSEIDKFPNGEQIFYLGNELLKKPDNKYGQQFDQLAQQYEQIKKDRDKLVSKITNQLVGEYGNDLVKAYPYPYNVTVAAKVETLLTRLGYEEEINELRSKK